MKRGGERAQAREASPPPSPPDTDCLHTPAPEKPSPVDLEQKRFVAAGDRVGYDAALLWMAWRRDKDVLLGEVRKLVARLPDDELDTFLKSMRKDANGQRRKGWGVRPDWAFEKLQGYVLAYSAQDAAKEDAREEGYRSPEEWAEFYARKEEQATHQGA